MKRISLLFVGVLLLSAFTFIGCGKKDVENDEDLPTGRLRGKPTGANATAQVREPLKAPLDGIIRGRVVLEGAKPPVVEIATMKTHNDHAGCLEGSEMEKIKQEWIIGKDNGVANVVIFLKPPAGKYFELKEEDKKRTNTVIVHQPHCAFIPHVLGTYPSYFDGKKQEPSGQKFEIKNDAPFSHNTHWKGDPIKNPEGNRTLKSGESLDLPLQPEANPLQLNCDIHPWMNAKVWVFDNPYFAVTDNNGNYEIKNVPTGVDLGVVAWHEVAGYFNGGRDGTKQKFNPGENKKDFSISAK